MRVSASHAARWRRACPARSRSTSRTTTRLPRTRATPFGRLPLCTSIGSRPYNRARDPAARGAGRRARRADRDPVRERRPGARWRPPTGRRMGRRADPGRGGTVEILEREGRPFVDRRGAGIERRRRAGRARVRAPRRPAARPARALGVRPVDARRAERLARRARRRGRQGAPLHAARGDPAPRRRRRAARHRPLRDRRGGGDQR